MQVKNSVLVFSRSSVQRGGGLEAFNRNFIHLLLKSHTNVYFAQEQSENLYISYVTRIIKTVVAAFKLKPRCIFVQYGSFLDIISIPLLSLGRAPVVVIAHVSSSWAHLSSPILRTLALFVLRSFASKLLVLSEDQKNTFRDVCGDKIHTIISPEFALQDSAQFPREGFLFIGRISVDKGIFDVLRAWALLAAREKRLKLTIVGNGQIETLENVRRLVNEQNLSELVHIRPAIREPAEVARAMDSVQGVVYPTYKDAFPLVMLESFARGTPCIVSRVGEGPAYVQNPDLIVEPGDIDAIAEAVLNVANGNVQETYLSQMTERSRLYARGQILADLRALNLISQGAS